MNWRNTLQKFRVKLLHRWRMNFFLWHTTLDFVFVYLYICIFAFLYLCICIWVYETHIFNFWAVQYAVWHSTLDKSRTNFATRGSLSTSNLQPGRAGRLQFKKQTNTNEIRAGRLKRLSQTNLKYKYQIKITLTKRGGLNEEDKRSQSLEFAANVADRLETGNKSVGSTVYRLSDELDNQLRRFAGQSR